MPKLQDGRQTGWFWDHNEIWDMGLSHKALLVRLYLARCADEQGRAFPSIAKIAEKCGMSRSSAVRGIKELVDCGLVIRHSRKVEGSNENDTTVYILVSPKGVGSEGTNVGSHRTDLGSERPYRSVHTEPTVGSHRTREQDPYNNTQLNKTDRLRAPARETAPPTRPQPPLEPKLSVGPSVDYQIANQAYHEHIGLIGPSQHEKLKWWIDEKRMSGDVVAKAIEVAKAEGKPRMQYIEGVLRNWHNDGVRKLEDLQPRHLDKKVERSPPEDDMSTIIAELKAEEEGTRGVG